MASAKLALLALTALAAAGLSEQAPATAGQWARTVAYFPYTTQFGQNLFAVPNSQASSLTLYNLNPRDVNASAVQWTYRGPNDVAQKTDLGWTCYTLQGACNAAHYNVSGYGIDPELGLLSIYGSQYWKLDVLAFGVVNQDKLPISIVALDANGKILNSIVPVDLPTIGKLNIYDAAADLKITGNRPVPSPFVCPVGWTRTLDNVGCVSSTGKLTPYTSPNPSVTPTPLPSASSSPIPAAPLLTPFVASNATWLGKSVIVGDTLYIINGKLVQNWNSYSETPVNKIDLHSGTVSTVIGLASPIAEYTMNAVVETSTSVLATLCGGWNNNNVLQICQQVDLVYGGSTQLISDSSISYTSGSGGSWLNRIFLLGGYNFGSGGTAYYNDVTVVSRSIGADGSATYSAESESFAHFNSARAAYDQLSNLLVLFGTGSNFLSIVDMDKEAQYNFPANLNGSWPVQRIGGVLAGVRIDVVDPVAKIFNFIFLLHGGAVNNTVLNDVWILTVSNSTQANATAPYTIRWASINAYAPGLLYHSAAVLQDNYVFLSAGVTTADVSVGNTGVYAYSVKDAKWITDVSVFSPYLPTPTPSTTPSAIPSTTPSVIPSPSATLSAVSAVTVIATLTTGNLIPSPPL